MTDTRWTAHYAVNLVYCNCGARLLDDHVAKARRAEAGGHEDCGEVCACYDRGFDRAREVYDWE